MATPKLEADADAEAIFWAVKIDDSRYLKSTFQHYLRIKIFNLRGREKYSKVSIPFPRGGSVENIMARVIKPDGTTINVKKEEIFEQDLIKTKFGESKAVSFAVPSLEVGSILEYKYSEVTVFLGLGSNPIVFQKEIPIYKITYIIKPNKLAEFSILTFNMSKPIVEKTADDFYQISAENIPALKTEPLMPPEKEIVKWFFVKYANKQLGFDINKFWHDTAGVYVISYRLKDILKFNEKVKTAALGIIGDAQTDEEKLFRLYEFCRTKIKHLDYNSFRENPEIRKILIKNAKIKADKSPLNTLKNRQALPLEIKELFASLATSLNYEVRYVFTGDKNEILFSPDYQNGSLIHFAGIAIKLNNRWNFYNPSEQFLQFGMMNWFEENQNALLVSSDSFSWNKIPASRSEKSLIKREGKFKLLPDNTIEGDIRLVYSGHFNILRKKLFENKTQSELEKFVRAEILLQSNLFEINNIKIENLNDLTENLTISYSIKSQNYATKTQTRLFLEPNFFKFGSLPVFSSSTRNYDIYFDFPWSEEDEIEIEIPDGFEIEPFESPENIENKKFGSSNLIKLSVVDNKILYKRNFKFGIDGKIIFPASDYNLLKKLFDEFYRTNRLFVLLKQK